MVLRRVYSRLRPVSELQTHAGFFVFRDQVRLSIFLSISLLSLYLSLSLYLYISISPYLFHSIYVWS